MHGNAAAAAMQNSASSGSLGPPPTQSPPSVPSVHAERYRLFRSLVAKQSFGFDGGAWTFFDHGPREDKTPLVLLPAVTGSAAGFFHVLLTLGAHHGGLLLYGAQHALRDLRGRFLLLLVLQEYRVLCCDQLALLSHLP